MTEDEGQKLLHLTILGEGIDFAEGAAVSVAGLEYMLSLCRPGAAAAAAADG